MITGASSGIGKALAFELAARGYVLGLASRRIARLEEIRDALHAKHPGLKVELIASSCCGMAGAFGYQAETVEISRKMAEADLLPAIRAADADTLIVADGTSCRHQIKDGSGRRPLHVAEVLAAALP